MKIYQTLNNDLEILICQSRFQTIMSHFSISKDTFENTMAGLCHHKFRSSNNSVLDTNHILGILERSYSHIAIIQSNNGSNSRVLLSNI